MYCRVFVLLAAKRMTIEWEKNFLVFITCSAREHKLSAKSWYCSTGK